MAAHWYCLINGREHGPFSSDKIQRLTKSGKLKREDSVRPETDRHWTPATAIPGLFPDESVHPVPPVAKAAPPKAAKKRATAPPQGKSPPPAPDQAIAVAAPVPRAIPLEGDASAIPSAKPVATPVAAPVATPVAAPVAAPVGQSGAQPAVAVPSAVLPTAGAQSRGASELVHRGKRKSQQLYIVVGGLAASLIVLGGIAVFVLNRGPKEKKADVEVASPMESQEADPATAGVDPETDPVPKSDAPVQASATAQRLASLPSLTRWLDATRQKGGLRGIVKLGVSDVWLEPAEAGGQVLNVNVAITNLQSDQSLDFKGFNTSASRSVDTTVFLADSSGDSLRNLAGGDASAGAARRSLRMAPGELLTQQLSFVIENTDSEQFRLALPYAALGHTGYLGFEIPRLMVQDRPPGADEEDFAVDGAAPTAEPEAAADQVRVEESPRRNAENDVVEPDTEPDAAEAGEPKRQGGQPETISDLLRSIEDNSQDAADGQDPADGQDE